MSRSPSVQRLGDAISQNSTDRFVLKLGLFYAAYFAFGGIQLPFLPLWLEARGLEARTIGLVIAVPTLVRIVVTPLVTHQADRRRALKAALVIASAAATLAMALVGLVQGAVAIALTLALAACAFSPLLPLTDAYALSGLGARGRAYGPVRLWGSVAFIAGNIGAGALLGWLAPGHLIWLLVAALAAATVAAVALAPLETADKSAPATPMPSPMTLLRNRAFLAVALSSSMVQGSHAVYYGFSTLEWRAAGLSGALIGVLWALGVLAEILLFAFSARLPASLRPTVLLAAGAVGAFIRWGAMAFDPPVAALPALQILHGASFGAAHLGAMGFLARGVPRELAATAQGLVATWSGIVMATAIGVSGAVYAASGAGAYLVMAAMASVGFVAAAIAGRWWSD